MTYNIGFGAYRRDYSFFMDGGKSSWAKDEESVMASVSAMGEIVDTVSPDFVLLQEIDIDGTRSYHVDELELLNQFIKGYYYDFAQNYDSPFLFFLHGSPTAQIKPGLPPIPERKSGRPCAGAFRFRNLSASLWIWTGAIPYPVSLQKIKRNCVSTMSIHLLMAAVMKSGRPSCPCSMRI